MLHVRFLRLFLPELASRGIGVNLETCGLFRWPDIQDLLPYLNLVYFDLKHLDSGDHQRLTGKENNGILENFRRLSKIFPHLQARMPIVPGMNDAPAQIVKIARFLRSCHQKTIHCLPYHNYGEAKLPRIGSTLKPLELASATPEEMGRVERLFQKEEIHAIVYD